MIPEGVIETILQSMARSVNNMLIDRDEGRLDSLPGLSGRLIGHIEKNCRQQQELYRSRVIQCNAKAHSILATKLPEFEHGADAAVILDVDIDNYRINMGFLAHSILTPHARVQGTYMVDAGLMDSEPDPPNPHALKRPTIGFEVSGVITFILPAPEFRDLVGQCQKMLFITPDSFVFLYCEDDIYVVPASSITSLHHSESYYEFHCKNFRLFFSDFLRCFVGDERLCAFSDQALRQLAQDNYIDHLLYLQILDLTLG